MASACTLSKPAARATAVFSSTLPRGMMPPSSGGAKWPRWIIAAPKIIIHGLVSGGVHVVYARTRPGRSTRRTSENAFTRAGTQLEDGVAGYYTYGLVHLPGDEPFDFVDERPFLVPTGRERVPDLPTLFCCLIAHRDRF